jgi:nucleoside-diphosphate-sugar epimerase
VRAVSRRQLNGPWNEQVLADISATLPPGCCEGIDTVLHLAGVAHALSATKRNGDDYYGINSEGTRHLLEAAKAAGVSRFIYFSSVKAMGEGGPQEMDESTVCRPTTAYGQSKLEAEELVTSGEYVPESVVLRLSMVYGPTDKGNLPRMVKAIAEGRFPPLPEVNNKRSMVHVADVVQAALLAMEKSDAAGRTYIVTDGRAYSTRQIYEWICEVLNRRPPRWTVPVSLLRGLAAVGDVVGWARGRRFTFDSDAMDKLIGSAWYSSRRISQELGFLPRYSLEAALPELVSFLQRS